MRDYSGKGRPQYNFTEEELEKPYLSSELQGVVMDIHNKIVENAYRFRCIGKLIDEE
jgi:hypothetical protein